MIHPSAFHSKQNPGMFAASQLSAVAGDAAVAPVTWPWGNPLALRGIFNGYRIQHKYGYSKG